MFEFAHPFFCVELVGRRSGSSFHDRRHWSVRSIPPNPVPNRALFLFKTLAGSMVSLVSPCSFVLSPCSFRRSKSAVGVFSERTSSHESTMSRVCEELEEQLPKLQAGEAHELHVRLLRF